MLNQLDIVFVQQNNEKPDMSIYKVGAFIINSEAVEVGIYKNELFDLLEFSDISEGKVYEDLQIRVDFTNKETKEITQIKFSEMLGAILLSNSNLIAVPIDRPWVEVGTQYIDNDFVR
jgi:hypothetical protein